MKIFTNCGYLLLIRAFSWGFEGSFFSQPRPCESPAPAFARTTDAPQFANNREGTPSEDAAHTKLERTRRIARRQGSPNGQGRETAPEPPGDEEARMYPDLNGKTAVVTGASIGLGHSIAERFLEEGMNVVVNFHSDKHAAGARELVDRFDGPERTRAVAVQGDVTREEDVDRLRQAALDAFGDLDVWVNNAGIESRRPTHELPLADWNKMIEVDLTGVFLGSKAALASFVERGRPGVIINLSSVHERIPWPTFAAYAAGKGGVKLFSQTIALEYARRGIRVNCIAPGAIETPINAEKFADPAARAKTEEMIPLGRIGAPEDVAAAAAWLASDQSGYVTGHSLFVDGGMSLYPSFEEGDG